MMVVENFNRSDFQFTSEVTAETLESYTVWYDLLRRWNSRINLVAPRTLENFWLRHAMDSHQIFSLLPPESKTVLDLGAGAGFPGIALAIMLRNRSGAFVKMVESNGKKCNFLRTVIRELNLPAEAIQQRAEDLSPERFDVITARAFAPLPKLFSYAQIFWGDDTVGIFPKGESWETEIQDASSSWHFEYKTQKSQTDENARILLVEGLHLKSDQHHRGGSIDQKSA